ncbi:MAG: translation initiation factor IF-2 N-terminal domain-containing protein, partial [Acidobacteriaceae bacterium]|nr:translation initiation factor IF-2 N-terminal domain-containing protein [Acidobacteriaceae bacterium]
MKKVRINELARELEVKPGVIIDLLPELGVHEKKTHSSSVDEEVALELRRRLCGSTEGPQRESRDESVSKPSSPAAEEAVAPPVESEPQEPVVRPPLNAPLRPHGTATPPPAAPTPPPPAIETSQPEAEAASATTPSANPPAGTVSLPEGLVEHDRPIPSFRPLRPPLGGGGAIHPPLAQQSGQPHTPGLVNRTIAIPAKPAPTLPFKTRPSMPVASPTGPRQPLPPESPKPVLGERAARPGPGAELPPPPLQTPLPKSPLAPTHVVVPGPSAPLASSPTVPGSPAPRQPVPRPSSGLTPGAPIAPRPAGSRPGLAGQPAARPVVPPRQDILQRLNKQPTRPGQAASPTAARPGAPARPSPAPGQPLYR